MFSALKKLVGSEQAPGRDRNIPAGLQSMNQALQRRFAKGVQYNSECGPARGRLRGVWGGWGPGRAARDSPNPGSARALVAPRGPCAPRSGEPSPCLCLRGWRGRRGAPLGSGGDAARRGGPRAAQDRGPGPRPRLCRLACGSLRRKAGPGATGVRPVCTARLVQAAPGASAAPWLAQVTASERSSYVTRASLWSVTGS